MTLVVIIPVRTDRQLASFNSPEDKMRFVILLSVLFILAGCAGSRHADIA